MTCLPAVATVVFEADQVTTEVRTLLQETRGAQGVLEVGIHLDLLVELLTLDLDKGSRDCLHVAPGAAEGHPAAANGIPVLVSINASIHHSSKQVIEDPGKDNE